MININILKDKNDSLISFSCKGHAGYANSGKDIICSAVSALVINTINSVEAFTETKLDIKTDESTGYIFFSINGQGSDKSQLLFDSLELGLNGIMNDYGKRFISISVKKEV